MKYLALSIPDINGNTIPINPPANIPTGGPAQLGSILGYLIEVLMFFGILLSLLYLIWGGFDWIMSSGDKQKLANSKQKLIYALVGLATIFMAFFIINLISTILGINLLSIPSQ